MINRTAGTQQTSQVARNERARDLKTDSEALSTNQTLFKELG